MRRARPAIEQRGRKAQLLDRGHRSAHLGCAGASFLGCPLSFDSTAELRTKAQIRGRSEAQCLGGQFQKGSERVEQAEEAYGQVFEFSPVVAQYLVTHAHYRRVLSKLNLRECYHLFKLRTSELAHFAIREPMIEAMKLAVEAHPGLFQGLQLRD